MMSRVDAAWVAGIIEGEGCLRMQRHNRRDSTAYMLTVCMSDEDIVRKLHSITGVGYVYYVGRRLAPSGKTMCKPMWAWKVGARPEVVAICVAIREFMGERRGDRIDHVLLHWQTTMSLSEAMGRNARGQFLGKSPEERSMMLFDKTANRKMPQSGERGVMWHKKAGKWMARGNYGGGTYYLGLYEDKDDASRAFQTFRNEVKIMVNCAVESPA